jgi:hypothetical protein
MQIEAFVEGGAVLAELVDGAWEIQRWSDAMSREKAEKSFEEWWDEHREEMESAPVATVR